MADDFALEVHIVLPHDGGVRVVGLAQHEQGAALDVAYGEFVDEVVLGKDRTYLFKGAGVEVPHGDGEDVGEPCAVLVGLALDILKHLLRQLQVEG